MPSRKKGELILFSADDPSALVSWLVGTHGLQNVLGMLSEQRPRGTRTASKTSSKKGASKKGGKRGRPKGSKNAAKKGGAKKGSKKASKKGGQKAQGGVEVGRG